MPEGPSILHLRNQLLQFKGKIVKEAGGYGPMKTGWLKGKKLLDIKTWGKHLLLEFKDGLVKVHLGLFGDVLINERRKTNPSFYLKFSKGAMYGYIVKASRLEKPLEELYDWRTDIMSEEFNSSFIKKLLKEREGETIDDVLMDQDVFSGVGNKIRNEALFRAGIHPLSKTGKIPANKITALIREVIKYAKIFFRNLEKTGSNDDFGIYQRDYTDDGSEVTMKLLKKTKRKIYFSEHDQQLYK